MEKIGLVRNWLPATMVFESTASVSGAYHEELAVVAVYESGTKKEIYSMENTTTETLTVLASESNPHSYAAICIPAEQPLAAAQRLPLTHEEKRMLADNELQIEQGLNSYYEIGRALRVIQLGKLYRDEYESFDQYCRERWGFSRHRGYQLIRAIEPVDSVDNCQHSLPDNEYQGRLLLKLPDANARARAMKRANELAGNRKVTGTHIKQAIDEELGTQKTEVIDVQIVSEQVASDAVPISEKRPSPAESVVEPKVAVATSLFEQNTETSEQAIERLFMELRQWGESKKWEAGFTNIVDELEGRIDAVLKCQPHAKAA